MIFARWRLGAFVAERGVGECAWYEGVGSSQGVVTDVRAQQAYVAQYVAERQAAYGAEGGVEVAGASEMGEVGTGRDVAGRAGGGEGRSATGVRGGGGGLVEVVVREGVGITPTPFSFLAT
jgi:hypothetical protein